MNLIVPAPSQTFDVDLEDGAKIKIRRHGNCDGVRMMVTHGNGFALNLWPHASEFGGPVKLIGADPDLHGAPPTALTNQALATENGYDYDFFAGAGHLLQIEKPAQCVRLVEEFLTQRSLR
jgi:pimeloyl-ACP methyl ester carboxylesterase